MTADPMKQGRLSILFAVCGLRVRTLKQTALTIAPLALLAFALARPATGTTCVSSTPTLTSNSCSITEGSGDLNTTSFTSPSPGGLSLFSDGDLFPAFVQLNPETGSYLLTLNWSVTYTGPPATTDIHYDVIFGGSATILWSLEVDNVEKASGMVSGSGDAQGEVMNLPVIDGTYNITFGAASGGFYNATLPAEATIDAYNPVPSGIPEPATLWTIGTAAVFGFLLLRNRKKAD